jgi:hypothetical protein
MTFTARVGYDSCAAAEKMDKPRHVVKNVVTCFLIKNPCIEIKSTNAR